MQIEINKAEHSDRLFLARVCRDADILYGGIMPGAFEAQARKFEEKGLSDDYQTGMIKANGRKIGFLGFTAINDCTVYLVAIYLLTLYQRKGYGRAALDNLLDSFTETGYDEVVLLVHKDAGWAIDFYGKNGFEKITGDLESIKSYAGHGMEKYALPSTVLMRKRL